ncbi:MAG: hypothetical protein P4L92_06000 [Rudaea sp.]|nr:hypothetical protein [Rudaea sp.]
MTVKLGKATSVQHEASATPDNVLSRLAAVIAGEPDLAERLARIQPVDQFATALSDAARQRGITFDDAAREAIAGNRAAMFGSRVTQWPLASRRGWQPFALEWGPSGAELVWGRGVACAGTVFHEQVVMALRSLPMNRMFAVRTPLTREFISALEADALPVRGLVFHMSRCGSTLVAQALKAWPGVRVVGEPGLLDSAITLACAGNDPDWMIFRAVIAALAQPAGTDRDVTIKLDAWHALALTEIRRRICVPWLFVYRDPVEVLVSHAREPGRHTVPGMLPPAWFGTPVQTYDAAALVQYAAQVIGAICAAVAPHASAANLLNYEELPQALTRVAQAFDLDPRAADPDRLAMLLTRHAKRPHESFADDRATKRAAASGEIRAAAEHWIAPQYMALETIRRGSVA